MTVEEQIRQSPAYFVACTRGDECERRDECLRAMVWRESENFVLKVLNRSRCEFQPLKMRTDVRGIPKLDMALSHHDYKSFRYNVLTVVPRVTFYRIEKGLIYASDRYRKHIETVWGKYSKEPFPWLTVEESVDWEYTPPQ